MTLLVDVGKRKAGDPVGSPNRNGYVMGYLEKRLWSIHRLAFLYMTGTLPDGFVDHRDGNTSNNSWENIRPATHQQNMQNRKVSVLSHTGVKGVRKTKYGFSSTIKHNGTVYRLGSFATIEEARAAYLGAAKVLFGGFARS